MSTPLGNEIDELRRQLAEERRLRAELAQQEPVAWWRYEGCFADKFEKDWFQREKPESNGIPLYAAPVAKPAEKEIAIPEYASKLHGLAAAMQLHIDGQSTLDMYRALSLLNEARATLTSIAAPAAQDCVSVPRALLRRAAVSLRNGIDESMLDKYTWAAEDVQLAKQLDALSASKEPKT